MNRKCYFALFLMITILGSLQGQEVLSGLSGNPELIRLSKTKVNPEKSKSLQFKTPVDFIPLPFIDDFSGHSVFPDNYFWSDSNVYINSTFPIAPPSLGVATFDALNKSGRMYVFPDSVKRMTADVLTSRPIDLDPSFQNVYLSYYYEPRGIGDISGKPVPNDSLILEYYSPVTDTWTKIKNGSVADTVANIPVVFKQVIVPVESQYLNKGFRFRFRNYITKRIVDDPGQYGNTDYWHIDYVRLDKDRSPSDTMLNDIAFVRPSLSLLSPYQALPVDHYKNASYSLLNSSFDVLLHNNKNELIGGIQRRYEVKNTYTNRIVAVKDGANTPMDAYSFVEINDPVINPFNFDDSPDSAIFQVKSSIHYTDNPLLDNFQNDTAVFFQVFKNYEAYDDGSPERGYGLSGEGTENAMAAMGFDAFVPDSLTGISFFFNPTYKDTTQSYQSSFELAVWNDNNGTPGQMIYRKTTLDTVRYGAFPIYKLDSAIIVMERFYIGWIQTNNTSLNMGFDLNNDNHTALFVKTSTNWYQSEYNGTLMIRPVFRKIRNLLLSNRTIQNGTVHTFPNPASETVFIDGLTGDYPATCTILSLMGKTVLQHTLNADENIDVSNLTSGLYILKITGRKKQYAAVKLMIQH